MADATTNAAGPLSEGESVPDFDLPATGGGRVRSSALRGRPYVLYFYPKADTSGCTQQARAFQEALDNRTMKAIPVIGISRDPVEAIEAFAAKYDLRFPLASDETGSVVEAHGVWVQKSMYGRRYMGIERSTFLVDKEGRIARLWRKVKVPGHVAEVAAAAAALR
jgi:thioredoxin-dependent peroxiredoxin